MRTLKFKVDGLIVKPDESCDFEGLVPGTESYLKAEFSFSPEWSGCTKTINFFSGLGRRYPSQVLKDGKSCTIPAEALRKQIFKVQVVGDKTNFRLVTNKLTVKQNGGNV